MALPIAVRGMPAGHTQSTSCSSSMVDARRLRPARHRRDTRRSFACAARSSASRASTRSRRSDTQQLLYRILSTEQQKHLEIDRQIDFSLRDPRRRALPRQRLLPARALGAAFRLIPDGDQDARGARPPGSLHELAEKPRGLVLVTGPTGSGKSTTLAAMIDEINRNRAEHILTIEDPIEFLHRHKRCIVNQREIGPDATSFAEALRAALRQDPDVILLGEMRDLETISTALTAAETGHLVFGTLHTQSAPGTIDRIIDVFPAEQQEQVRTQLASSLQGVVTQTLLPTADGEGRVAGARDPASRRRRPQPDPPGQGRADLLGHADQHHPRHADDGAVARRPDPARVVDLRDRALSRSSHPDQLIGLLERSGFAVELPPDLSAQPAIAASSLGPACEWRELEMTDDKSIWKKEISFGRKRQEPASGRGDRRDRRDDRRADLDLEEGAQLRQARRRAESRSSRSRPVEQPVPSEQVWNKDASFSRPRSPSRRGARRRSRSSRSRAVEEHPSPPSRSRTSAESFEPARAEPARTPPPSLSPRSSRSPTRSRLSLAEAVEAEEVEPEAPTELERAARAVPRAGRRRLADVPMHVAAAVPVPAPEPGIHAPVTAERAAAAARGRDGRRSRSGRRSSRSAAASRRNAKAKRARRQPKEPKEPKAAEAAARRRKQKAAEGQGGARQQGREALVGLKIGASQLAAARVANNGSRRVAPGCARAARAGHRRRRRAARSGALAEALKDFFAKHKLPKKRRAPRHRQQPHRRPHLRDRRHRRPEAARPTRSASARRRRCRSRSTRPCSTTRSSARESTRTGSRRSACCSSSRTASSSTATSTPAGRRASSSSGSTSRRSRCCGRCRRPQEGAGADPSAALVAVSIGHDRSTFAVSDGRICEFTRVLEWGGSALNVAIARALDAAPSEVDGVKRALP